MGLKVYIAGPYTHGDPAANVSAAMEMFHILADGGHFPHCPHLSHFLHIQQPRDYEFWMRQDFTWLDVCDVVVRLLGKSPGADREVERAKGRNIPVLPLDSLQASGVLTQLAFLE